MTSWSAIFEKIGRPICQSAPMIRGSVWKVHRWKPISGFKLNIIVARANLVFRFIFLHVCGMVGTDQLSFSRLDGTLSLLK